MADIMRRHYGRKGPSDRQIIDMRDRAMWRCVAVAIGNWLEQHGALDRPIRSLQITELEGIAVAAVNAYQKFRQGEIAAEFGNIGHIPEFDDKLEDLFR